MFKGFWGTLGGGPPKSTGLCDPSDRQRILPSGKLLQRGRENLFDEAAYYELLLTTP